MFLLALVSRTFLWLFLAAPGILAGWLGGRGDSQALVRGALCIDEET